MTISAKQTLLTSLALEALGPLEKWSHECHAASVKIVQSGLIKGARVARGFCSGIAGQHSWVVLGDPYDQKATIIDATLWSYDSNVIGVYVGTRTRHKHLPHGDGNIFEWGRPPEPVGPIIELKPEKPWSPFAQGFLSFLGPLDENGWKVLAHAPVRGWPASEIFTVLRKHPTLGQFIPIDIVGMTTELAPKLYPRS